MLALLCMRLFYCCISNILALFLSLSITVNTSVIITGVIKRKKKKNVPNRWRVFSVSLRISSAGGEMSHRAAKYDYRFIIKRDNELTVCRHPNCHRGNIPPPPADNIMNSNLKIVSIKYKCLWMNNRGVCSGGGRHAGINQVVIFFSSKMNGKAARQTMPRGVGHAPHLIK